MAPPLRSRTRRQVRGHLTLTTSSHFLTYTHSAASSHVHVPLTHVLSVDISGSAVNAHVLVRNRHCLELVNVSGSFQEDNSEASSSAKDWVQDVMTAAYSGL